MNKISLIILSFASASLLSAATSVGNTSLNDQQVTPKLDSKSSNSQSPSAQSSSSQGKAQLTEKEKAMRQAEENLQFHNERFYPVSEEDKRFWEMAQQYLQDHPNPSK